MKTTLLALLSTTLLVIGSTSVHADPIPGADNPIHALLEYDGRLIAGGSFTEIGGVSANCVAAWDGSTWQALGEGMAGVQSYSSSDGTTLDFPPCVKALTVFQGQLVAGGTFTSAGGQPAACIAAWDGAVWQALGGGFSVSYTFSDRPGSFYSFPPDIYALAAVADSLFAGGLFIEAGGLAARNVARWRNGEWTAADGGLLGRGPARTLALAGPWQDQHVIAGGHFGMAGMAPASNLAGWDGTDWTVPGGGDCDDVVWSLLIDGGHLYVGGAFDLVGSEPVCRIARLRDGVWEPVGFGFPNQVRAMFRYHGHLYAGAFRQADDGWVNELQPDGPILALAQYDGHLVAGGDFRIAAGEYRDNLTVWPEDPASIGAAPPARPRLSVHPNPANPRTLITCVVPQAGAATVELYDSAGRLVRQWRRQVAAGRSWQVRWDGRDEAGRAASSGVYLARLRAVGADRSVKLTLLR